MSDEFMTDPRISFLYLLACLHGPAFHLIAQTSLTCIMFVSVKCLLLLWFAFSFSFSFNIPTCVLINWQLLLFAFHMAIIEYWRGVAFG